VLHEIQEVFLNSSLPLEKVKQKRIKRGDDTCRSFEEGKSIDMQRGQDRLKKYQSTTKRQEATFPSR
jgi:predicted methyltransferase